MKKCPTCNRTYSDETLSFCLVDGAILSASYDPNATLLIPEPRKTDAPPQTSPNKAPLPSTILSPEPFLYTPQTNPQPVPKRARISQVINYIFYLIYTLLVARFLLALLAVRPSGFTQFIYGVTNPLYHPFSNAVTEAAAGNYAHALNVMIAVIAYALLHLGINRLLRLLVHHKTKM